jgi:hypothetical protein
LKSYGRYTDRVDFTHICSELDAAQKGTTMKEVHPELFRSTSLMRNSAPP